MSDFALFWQQTPRNRKPDLVRAFRSLRHSLSTTHADSHDVEEVRKEEMHTTELLDGTLWLSVIKHGASTLQVAMWSRLIECIQVKSEPVLVDFGSSFSFIPACRHCLCKKRRKNFKKLTQKHFLTLKIMDSDWENSFIHLQINLQENVCL